MNKWKTSIYCPNIRVPSIDTDLNLTFFTLKESSRIFHPNLCGLYSTSFQEIGISANFHVLGKEEKTHIRRTKLTHNRSLRAAVDFQQ